MNQAHEHQKVDQGERVYQNVDYCKHSRGSRPSRRTPGCSECTKGFSERAGLRTFAMISFLIEWIPKVGFAAAEYVLKDLYN